MNTCETSKLDEIEAKSIRDEQPKSMCCGINARQAIRGEIIRHERKIKELATLLGMLPTSMTEDQDHAIWSLIK